MTHCRVYREAMPEPEALALIEQGGGSQFDPFLLGVFLALTPEMRRIADDNPEEGVEGGFSVPLACIEQPPRQPEAETCFPTR